MLYDRRLVCRLSGNCLLNKDRHILSARAIACIIIKMVSICFESTFKSQNILTVWWGGHSRWFKEASVDFKYAVVV